MEINNTPMVKIGAIITEAHPHFAYGFEQKNPFQEGDIITTCMVDPPPDREIFVVNEVFNEYAISVNKKIDAAMGKQLRKLTTVNEITSRIKDKQMEQAITEGAVRAKMHELFINEEFTGTIEERLMDGYLYTLCHDDLSLPPHELEEIRKQKASTGQRGVMVQTGKAGVLEFIKAGKRDGMPESIIARSIWIEMVVEGVRMYVCIKNLKVTKVNETDSAQEARNEPEEVPFAPEERITERIRPTEKDTTIIDEDNHHGEDGGYRRDREDWDRFRDEEEGPKHGSWLDEEDSDQDQSEDSESGDD